MVSARSLSSTILLLLSFLIVLAPALCTAQNINSQLQMDADDYYRQYGFMRHKSTSPTPNVIDPLQEQYTKERTPFVVPRSRVVTLPFRIALWAIEREMVIATNRIRARYGLVQLSVDPGIQNTARRHCYWMMVNGSMTHGNYPVAENIAWNQGSVDGVMNSWMNSSGHRANILNRHHRYIGVAAYRTARGSIYWCQQFRR